MGSLTGAVSSEIITEEFKGTLSLVGNQASSAKVEGCLTARLTSRAETKVGLSDPVIPYGRVIAHQIKGTLGITGLSLPSVHSGGAVWHLNKSGCCRSNSAPTNRLITVNPSAKLWLEVLQTFSEFRPAIPWEVFCQHTCGSCLALWKNWHYFVGKSAQANVPAKQTALRKVSEHANLNALHSGVRARDLRQNRMNVDLMTP